MLDQHTIGLLEDPVLHIPKVRPDGDFVAFLIDTNKQFFDLVDRFSGPVGERLQEGERLYWMRQLASSVEAAVEHTIKGRNERAWSLMDDILDEHWGTLRRMSLRHSLKVIGSRSWYRMTTWADAHSRRDVFHLPFDRVPPGYRYSAPGRPALYLGNNVYVCWLECKSPALETCKVARFEIDAGPQEFLDLPANHEAYLVPLTFGRGLPEDVDPVNVQNSPYYKDVESELVEYLALWPLLMACSVQRSTDAGAPHEYIVSQLLARWVLDQHWLGVRYFTTKRETSVSTNDLSINVVLPAQTTNKREGFCDVLAERVRCTEPHTFGRVAQVPDRELFTEEAADRRHGAAGRYMLRWENALHHYQHTPFGRMEYWLDRDDVPVGRIDRD